MINLDDLMKDDDKGSDDDSIIVSGLRLPDGVATPIEDIKKDIDEFISKLKKDNRKSCEVLNILGDTIVRLVDAKKENHDIKYIVAFMMWIIGNFHTHGSDEVLLHHMKCLNILLEWNPDTDPDLS